MSMSHEHCVWNCGATACDAPAQPSVWYGREGVDEPPYRPQTDATLKTVIAVATIAGVFVFGMLCGVALQSVLAGAAL